MVTAPTQTIDPPPTNVDATSLSPPPEPSPTPPHRRSVSWRGLDVEPCRLVYDLKVWVEVLRFRIIRNFGVPLNSIGYFVPIDVKFPNLQGYGSIVEREEFPEDFDKYLRTGLNWSRLEDTIGKTHVAGWGFWCRQDDRPPHAPPVSGLPNEKEAVYGALDKWTAWETEFPLIAASKALRMLRKRSRWIRVIQGFGSVVERKEFPEDFDKYLRTELNWSRLEARTPSEKPTSPVGFSGVEKTANHPMLLQFSIAAFSENLTGLELEDWGPRGTSVSLPFFSIPNSQSVVKSVNNAIVGSHLYKRLLMNDIMTGSVDTRSVVLKMTLTLIEG
ncbi:hypothetical protein RHGRI_000445 [Rhododendron griersonianum]|uniref:Aminotransferase-like plant mobile domain-containing protein n=1 Tax=Rhododendron griersonianum TaxID=479676 RepID=A0AAV6LHP0_9ERIC|nr:hypothetical protein RHGRI_000445 [Rhododendron griersonianum]